MKPHKDRRITTLHGALRQLSRHCGLYAEELKRALDRNDTVWLETEFRSHAIQIMMDIETLAGLASAEEWDPPYAVYGVIRSAMMFMVGLCDIVGQPDRKRELLQIIADCPISL